MLNQEPNQPSSGIMKIFTLEAFIYKKKRKENNAKMTQIRPRPKLKKVGVSISFKLELRGFAVLKNRTVGHSC